MKTCIECDRERPLDEFYARHKRAYRGRAPRHEISSRCKECSRARKRAWYEENRELALERVKAAYNPAAKATYDREYRRRPHVRKRHAEESHKWNLLRRAAPLDDDACAYVNVLRGDPCSYCGGAMKHVDHIVPLVAGGNSAWENLTAACGACNQRKSARPLLRFMAAR